MALYPPIIDSSRAMQLKNEDNIIQIYYTSNNKEAIETFEITAIHPRTGKTVLKDENGDLVETLSLSKADIVNDYIAIKIDGNIAQVTMCAKIQEATSIPSAAVIFKLFDETVSVLSDITSIDSSPFRYTAEVSFTGQDKDELAWYQASLFEAENSIKELFNSEKCYPTTKNIIDILLNYDFVGFSIDKGSYFLKIKYGTKNGIVQETGTVLGINTEKIPAAFDSWEGSFTMSFKREANILQVHYSLYTGPDSADSLFIVLYYKDANVWATLDKWRIRRENINDQTEFDFEFDISNRPFATEYRVFIASQEGEAALDWRQASDSFWYSKYGEDIILKESPEKQYIIKYNPEIGQMKRNRADIITPTLGAKFPFIYRNGYQDYRTFSIGGLIARLEDVDNINCFYIDENILQERLYREELLEFLYNDKIKLFSSLQEGEMLIKLSGVSLTPMKQLGRMLYSFSATATEVADCTSENLKIFGIEG